MLYYLPEFLFKNFSITWGPLRLCKSHAILIGLGTFFAAILTWYFLPRLFNFVPLDRGRKFAQNAEVSKGKPTGTGLIFVLLSIPVLALVVPVTIQMFCIILCLLLAMITGYLDDISKLPWGELKKGSLDLVIAIITSLVICQCKAYTVWLPFIKGTGDGGSFLAPVWVFVPIASVLIWLTINATNCSDGVDGLAGSLTMLSLFFLGGFMYLIIGHEGFAKHFILPHRVDGASWAILIFTSAGSLAGYLWHNAEPSRVLMGDAGSRFLGLLVAIAVLAAGNPFLILVTAPVVLVNGGTGLVKIVLLRTGRALGFDVTPPGKQRLATQDIGQNWLICLLHRFRFPLHDHCRKNLKWSNSQVLMRFVLLQLFLSSMLLGFLIKLR